MIKKLIYGLIICGVFQSCIREDEVVVDGTTVLQEKAIPLKIGESFSLNATYHENGKTYGTEGEGGKKIQYEYTVQRPNVVSVSPIGTVQALEKGNTLVEISAFGSTVKKVLFNIVQYDTSIASIDFLNFTDILVVASQNNQAITVKNYLGEKKEKIVDSWTSSNMDVASVDNNGLIKAHKTGTTEIQASIGNVFSFPKKLTVVDTMARFGQFHKIDYKTEGKGSLVLNDNNTLDIVFASDFFAENATGLPGVVVYLNNDENAQNAISSGLRVGAIPQNNGEFTMSVPIAKGQTGVENFTKYSHILLICEPFKISFGAAKLN